MRIRSKESYIFKTRSHQEAKIHQTTKKSNFIINWIVEIMDTIELPLHATIKQEVEDTFPIENDPVFGSTNLVLSPKQEDDSLMNSHHKYTEFEPDSNSPDLALAAVKDKESQAWPTLFENESLDVLSSSSNLNLYEPSLGSERDDVNQQNGSHCKSESDNTCRESFPKDYSLTSYARRIYNANGRHQCQICGKNYPWASDLDRHQRRHTGEKPYKCETCNKNFSQASSLKCHQRVHTGDKPYKCDICHKNFAFASTLKHHHRIHTGEKPYQCEMCNKKFTRAESLKYHQRIHTGDKPYKCEVCNRNFTQASNLNYHKKTHEKITPTNVE
ncbi:zinc finger protein 184-like isoform X5 [Artemia franciscana]|uniref:zinc finger protein 184-like isoform X5 n=1 Tax=Artemia franciscana TaxID=6661 RepID=UPI0032DA16AA